MRGGTTPMKTLLVVAHGSRREASNEEVRALAARLSARSDSGFDRVASDIPHLVAGKSREHPSARIIPAPHIGAAEGMLELLRSAAP